MSDLPPILCADCHQPIERQRQGWGRRFPFEGREGWDFCCRVTYEPRGDGTYKVVSADYHYVVGEEQRHFQAP